MSNARNIADVSGATAAGGVWSNKRLTINGNFDVWQRDTSLTNGAAGAFLADRWSTHKSGVGATYDASRQEFVLGQSDVPGAKYFHRWVIANSTAAGEYVHIDHKHEDLRYFDSRTVTISFWAKASAPFTLGFEFVSRYEPTETNGATGTAYNYKREFAVTTSWKKFTATVTTTSLSGQTVHATNSHFVTRFVPTTGSALQPRWGGSLNFNGTFDLAQVQLEYGSTATAFEHRPYATELALCQRYFVKIGGESSISAAGSGVTTATNSGWGVVTYPVTMRVAPTTTLNGTGITLSNGSVYPTSPSLGAVYANRHAAMISLTYSGTPYSGAGQGTTLYFQNAANDSMSFSSEL